MKYDINSLNDEQIAPLKEIKGAVLVTAGAGSGKTRLLTHRVAYLIKEHKVDPYNILAITFTNKAAGEMKERIMSMVEGADKVWISTFHSMCAKILRRDIDSLYPFDKNFSIYSEGDSEKIIKEVLDSYGIADDKIKKTVVKHLSNWKNGSQSLSEYLDTHNDEYDMLKIGQIIKGYQERLKKNNALDFDDLLCKTVELFKSFPDILSYYANRFEYILVDEFQDTNSVQYDLVKMLASVHGNLFVVGDEDQCIYSWRGANFQNIFKLKKDFPDLKVFKLERNYRSTSEIIKIANNVIKNNSDRLDKNMWTDKEGGQKPTLYNAYDEREEALYVAKNILRLKGEGYNFNDIAVLMRMNALSRNFEEVFLSYNIPHRIFGGLKFYERAEIKNVISYLRLFANPKDDVSFARIINFPKRGIGEGTLAKLRELDQNKALLENVISEKIKDYPSLYKKFLSFIEGYNNAIKIDNKELSKFVEGVIKAFKIRENYNVKEEENLNRLMNIEQFVSSVKEFEALNPDANLTNFLESITLSSDTDEIGLSGAVTIATIHSVKGLEFKCVFVVGLEEGIFPISRALNSNRELEEERRLMYVALTRAEEKLYLSYASKRYLYKESQYQTPSRFCREIGLLSLEKTNQSISQDRQYSYSSSGRNGNYLGNREANISPNQDYNSYYNKHGSMQENTSQGKTYFDKASILRKQEEKPKRDVSIYKIGQKVEHPKYGNGEIVDISPDGLVGDIIFESFGKKSLMLELAPLTIL